MVIEMEETTEGEMAEQIEEVFTEKEIPSPDKLLETEQLTEFLGIDQTEYINLFNSNPVAWHKQMTTLYKSKIRDAEKHLGLLEDFKDIPQEKDNYFSRTSKVASDYIAYYEHDRNDYAGMATIIEDCKTSVEMAKTLVDRSQHYRTHMTTYRNLLLAKQTIDHIFNVVIIDKNKAMGGILKTVQTSLKSVKTSAEELDRIVKENVLDTDKEQAT